MHLLGNPTVVLKSVAKLKIVQALLKVNNLKVRTYL